MKESVEKRRKNRNVFPQRHRKKKNKNIFQKVETPRAVLKYRILFSRGASSRRSLSSLSFYLSLTCF